MQAVNKKMDPQKTLQTMQNFQKENMKMEMTEEMSELCFSSNVSLNWSLVLYCVAKTTISGQPCV